MNRKISAAIIIAIIIIGTVGIIAYQIFGNSAPLITVTYMTQPITHDSYWFISDTSTVTFIVVNANFSCSKHFSFTPTMTTLNSTKPPALPNSLNINDFYLTSNGQPLTTYILTMGTTNVLNSTSGLFAISAPFDFTVRGNVTSYQLVYNGTANVKVVLENP